MQGDSAAITEGGEIVLKRIKDWLERRARQRAMDTEYIEDRRKFLKAAVASAAAAAVIRGPTVEEIQEAPVKEAGSLNVPEEVEEAFVSDDGITWRPAGLTDVPDPIPGYQFRWIRMRLGEQLDTDRLVEAKQEGWEAVLHGGHTYCYGDLMLCKKRSNT